MEIRTIQSREDMETWRLNLMLSWVYPEKMILGKTKKMWMKYVL